MSTQIAIRLPDDLVEFVDEQVRAGAARSRADLIGRMLAREVRRDRSARDLERVLADRDRADDDLDDLAAFAGSTILDLA